MIVSIDIGTSYCSISKLTPEGKALAIDIGTGVSMFGSKHAIPSAVFVEESGNLLLGQAATNSRKRNPQNFRDEFKRNLGETVPILLGPRQFLPEELYTEFYRHMKACAETSGGEEIELAYLTYPASYGKSKKDKIIAAAKAAGLFQTELVDEPTAAAMCYCAAGFVQDKQNLLIYDFGGGTFDVSVIRYEDGTFRPLAESRGLERCGGIDIDRLIFQDMLSKVDPNTLRQLQQNTQHYMRFVAQLSELAVKCKHHLSTADEFDDVLEIGWDTVPYFLSAERYNEMIAQLVGQTIQLCRQTLTDAGLTMQDLSAVLLVGGTSRVRLVRQMVEQMAGSVPVYSAADLDLAVSQGALNYRNYRSAELEQPKEATVETPKEPTEEKTTETDEVMQIGTAEDLYRTGKMHMECENYILAQKYLSDAAGYGHSKAQALLDKLVRAIDLYKTGIEQMNRGEYNFAECSFAQAAALGHTRASKELQRLTEKKQAAEQKKEIKKEETIVQIVERVIKNTPGITPGAGDYQERSLGQMRYNLCVPREERVLLAHDDSWFNRGANGYILTDKGIYACEAFCRPEHITWEVFAQDDSVFLGLNGCIRTRVKSGGTHLVGYDSYNVRCEVAFKMFQAIMTELKKKRK